MYDISPVDAIKDYTEKCGGDGDNTILKLAPPPPPLARELRPSSAVCEKEILSADYATKVTPKHIMRTQLLCCWDDPLGTTQCTRHPCPYRHATDLQKQLPAGTPEQQTDFYEFIPCNFAGMPGGCNFHNTRFKGENWNVPEWRIDPGKPIAAAIAATAEQIYLHATGETVEYVPAYDGNAWELRLCEPCRPQMQREQITAEGVQLDTFMKERIERYIAGCDDDSDSCG